MCLVDHHVFFIIENRYQGFFKTQRDDVFSFVLDGFVFVSFEIVKSHSQGRYVQ